MLGYGQRSLILVVDNYDSCVYNLVQYIGRYRDDIVVRRNDAITADGPIVRNFVSLCGVAA